MQPSIGPRGAFGAVRVDRERQRLFSAGEPGARMPARTATDGVEERRRIS